MMTWLITNNYSLNQLTVEIKTHNILGTYMKTKNKIYIKYFFSSLSGRECMTEFEIIDNNIVSIQQDILGNFCWVTMETRHSPLKITELEFLPDQF